ncbi:MAG: DUF2207 domain-containing protein [bacterium]|nr:DUF2207 domain-containing protein [bacterium]
MRIFHIIVGIIAIAGAFILSPVSYAQESLGEHIKEFNVAIFVEENGTLLIQETITYDFGNEQRHGIKRNIPFVVTNEEGENFAMEIGISGVTDENEKGYRYKEEVTDEEVQLKIGDPDTTISGIHTYVIRYNVRGALRYFIDADELYWNAIGSQWDLPILKANVEVYMPESIVEEDLEFRCFEGPVESNEQCKAASSGNKVTLYTDNLQPAEGMTIVVRFPTGVVAMLEPKEIIPPGESWWGRVLSVLFAITASIWYVFYPLWLPFKWYRDGRDPSTRSARSGQVPSGPVSASFDPPKIDGRNLTPAETGALIDEEVNIREHAATLVQLAQRGYFKIVETKKKEFELIKSAHQALNIKLLPYEQTLIDGLFASGDTVRLKDANLVSTLSTVEDMVYGQLITNKHFPHNPKELRKTYGIIVGLSLFTFNILLAISAGFFGKNMPRKTQSGKEAANRAESLKRFLESQERQLKHQADNQVMFEKLLPYAIAFGVERVWAERFKDLTLKNADWYETSDHNALTAGVLTNNLTSSFAPAFKSASTPVTSSSGFSSGMSSGSSGGGGGGGGGGNW